MKKLRTTDIQPSPLCLLAGELGEAKVAGGGVYLFKPGETAHPEARHVHEVDEVFLVLQGKGVIPIDGVEYDLQAGDVVIVHAGEDHHTRSSADQPLVVAWYVMDRAAVRK